MEDNESGGYCDPHWWVVFVVSINDFSYPGLPSHSAPRNCAVLRSRKHKGEGHLGGGGLHSPCQYSMANTNYDPSPIRNQTHGQLT